MCNDAHFSFTGFGKYGKEVLKRLAAQPDRFEVGELACYSNIGDRRDMDANWMFYANSVDDKHPHHHQYTSHPQNEFGRWRFERTILDFKPDIVWDIRDYWMLSFEGQSPLRPFYHWCIMPPVDSAPQQEEWIESFINADSVFVYSDWAIPVLQDEGGGNINVVCSAPPGCDIHIYRPVPDKEKHKDNMGFIVDSNIIGTVMRNQGRKLYPDLFVAFRKFLDLCYENEEYELAEKTYLYIHTSYPDHGWDIPELLKRHGIGHKVIFTYICQNETCSKPFCSFFRDARTVCPHCNKSSAMLPNTSVGLKPEHLAAVINMFDVYIQYAVCEGFGMPQVEAASCGVPIMSVDYSAMSDIVRKTGGIPLKVERMFADIGTGADRALPDNDDTAHQIKKFFNMPIEMRRKMGRKAREAVEKFYTWDNTASIWAEYFENLELTGTQGRWDAPIRPCDMPPPMPKQNMPNSEFVNWGIINVMQEPSFVNTRFSMRHLRDLNYGFKKGGRSIIRWNKEELYEEFRTYAMNKRDCEMARTNVRSLEELDFIQYAHRRMEYIG